MVKRDIVVVGASAGGVEALQRLVGGLPANLPAAIFVVLHLPASGTSALARILDRFGALPAAMARDGEPIQPGRIYVAPPDVHLVLKRDRVVQSRAPRENGFRPAVDPLFRSAAHAFGSRVVGVILSGTGDDGTLGLGAIKKHDGIAIVQSPDDALFPGMPNSALQAVDVDDVLPIDRIPARLAELAGEAVPDRDEEVRYAAVASNHQNGANPAEEGANGRLSGFTCPECGGMLREVNENNVTRYRCRIGHIFSPERLMVESTDALEYALWSAVRALEERTDLARRLERRMRQADCLPAAERYHEQGQESEEAASVIRQLLLSGVVSNRDVPEDPEEITSSDESQESAG